MTLAEARTSQDTAALWAALLVAKDEGDTELVRAIEQRMREVAADRRYAHLSDDELRRRIDGLTAQREPKGMLGHSPVGSAWEGGHQSTHTSRHNAAIRANQHDGIEVTLAALQAEWDRRHSQAD